MPQATPSQVARNILPVGRWQAYRSSRAFDEREVGGGIAWRMQRAMGPDGEWCGREANERAILGSKGVEGMG